MLSYLFFASVGLAIPAGYHPVVVSGPFLGQSLEVLNEKKFDICNTKGDWKHLWINGDLTDPTVIYCISQAFKLGEWDNENQVSMPVDDVRVRPFGYAGSTKEQFDGVKNFAGGPILDGPGQMIERLAELGYTVGDGLYGHTYDWRLGVRDWEKQYMPSFKQIIEDAVTKANGAAAVLTGISMSGQYTHAFLSWVRREYGEEWAAKYVHAFVPVAAGFNGAVMALEVALDSALGTYRTDGDCPNCEPKRSQFSQHGPGRRRLFAGVTDWFQKMAYTVGDQLMTELAQSFPSLYLVCTGIDHSTTPPTDPEVITVRNHQPAAECSAEPSTATVCGAKKDASGYALGEGFLGQTQCGECMWTYSECPTGFDRAYDGWTQDLCCKRHECTARTYHASEIPELLREMGQEKQAQMMEYSLTIDTTSDPQVPVHCVYSHNVQTFNHVALSEDLWSNPEKEDLTNAWFTLDEGDQTVDGNSLSVCDRWASTVKSYRIPGVAHSSMLAVEQVMDVIVAVASEDHETLTAWTPPSYSEVRPEALKVAPDVLIKRDDFDSKRLQRMAEY